MSWIQGCCYSKFGDFKRDEWPDRFAAIPRKGETIISQRTGTEMIAVEIKHCLSVPGCCLPIPYGDPYIIVELA